MVSAGAMMFFSLRLWGSTVVEIPGDVAHAPLVVDLVVGEQREELDVGIVALHVGGNVEELSHERAGLDVVEHILLVVEQQLHQPFGVAVLLFVEAARLARFAAVLLQLVAPSLVQVVLERLADIVVDAGRGVGGCQLLTLGLHREDAANDHRRACIDGNAGRLENLGEVPCHTAADAVVLALADGCQFAQALDGRRVEVFQLFERRLASGGQFACLVGIAQDAQRCGVVTLGDEPARAVAAVVAHVERLVALRGRGQRRGAELAVVV